MGGVYWSMRDPTSRSPRKSDITLEYAAKRPEFCRLHEKKTVDWWKGVIFSDETFMQLGCGDYIKWVWCPRVSFNLHLFLIININKK